MPLKSMKTHVIMSGAGKIFNGAACSYADWGTKRSIMYLYFRKPVAENEGKSGDFMIM